MDNRQSRATDILPRSPAARDWRDTLRDATDLALAGILMTLAALPVVTAGAAIGAASTAIAQWTDQERFPGVRVSARTFARGILPGLPPLLITIAAAALLRLNIHALGTGLVPGGRPLIWATALLGLVLAGFAGMVVVEFGRAGAEPTHAGTEMDRSDARPARSGAGPDHSDGEPARSRGGLDRLDGGRDRSDGEPATSGGEPFRQDGAGWRTAVRDAARLVAARPAVLAASTGIMAFTIGLGYLLQAILVPILAGYTLLALHVVRRRLG
ncbi:hypothetical protein [Catenuloplanes japonicus]|uniref:hypothetical protein n=1 Tax=Catenuloplanes japonicus TaxID=33876 RepID=UPI00068C48B0|nr:hypothetical protein [Catenuloplanes japonicus]